jgi:hypothetical protein
VLFLPGLHLSAGIRDAGHAYWETLMKTAFKGWCNVTVFLLAFLFILILTEVLMSSAKGEYLVHIIVVNETDEFQNIIVFQQDDEMDLMFKNMFPVPWQIFPLPGVAQGLERMGTAEFPFSQEIGITKSNDATSELLAKLRALGRRYGAGTGKGSSIWSQLMIVETAKAAQKNVRRETGNKSATLSKSRDAISHIIKLASAVVGKLTIKAMAVNGDKFEYSVDEKGGQYIVKLGNRNKDGSITCRNKSDVLVNIDFYKNDNKVAVWPSLANGDEAQFFLKRNISFTYDSNLKRGSMIKSRIEGDNVVTVELAGYSYIEARLMYDRDAPGKKKKWVITKY